MRADITVDPPDGLNITNTTGCWTVTAVDDMAFENTEMFTLELIRSHGSQVVVEQPNIVTFEVTDNDGS